MTAGGIRCGLLFVAVVLAVLLSFGVSAHAQGTMNQVSDPMGSNELAGILEPCVAPTYEQWMAIESAHESYLEAFAELRAGAIEEILVESEALRSGVLPSAAMTAEYLGKLDRVNARIRALDERFFDDVAGVVRDDQQPGIERARLTRERKRLRSGRAGQMVMLIALDLSDVLDAAKLNEEQLQMLDDERREYEERLTRLLRKMNKQTSQSSLLIAEEVEARGHAGLDISDTLAVDPKVMAEVGEARNEGYLRAINGSEDVAKKNRELNSRSIRAFADLLDPRTGRKLKVVYYPYAVGVSGWEGDIREPGGKPDVVLMIDRLLEEESLDEEMRGQLEVLLDAYLVEDNQILDKGIVLLQGFNSMAMMMEAKISSADQDARSQAGQPRTKTTSELMIEELGQIHERRAEASNEVRDKVLELIAPLGDRRLDVLVRSDADEWRRLIGTELNEKSTQSEEFDLEPYRPVERPWLLEAITVGDVARMRRLISAEQWQNAVLDSIHNEYLANWSESVGSLEEEITRLRRAAYAWDEVAQKQQIDMDKIDAQRAVQVRCLDAARAVDEEFFEHLRSTMSEEVAPLIRVLELERAYDRAMGGTGGDPGVSSAQGYELVKANPMRLLEELDLPVDKRRDLLLLLGTTGEPLVEAMQASFEQRMENAFRWDRASAQLQLDMVQRPPEEQGEIVEAYNSLVLENNDLMLPLSNQLIEQQEEFLRELNATLSSEALESFKNSWWEASHPEIYRNASNIQPVFRRAERLRELSPSQAEAIAALDGEYMTAWGELSRRMTDLSESLKKAVDWEEDSEQEDALRARVSEIQRLQFQREELAARTLRRLGGMLEPEQRELVRGLQE